MFDQDQGCFMLLNAVSQLMNIDKSVNVPGKVVGALLARH